MAHTVECNFSFAFASDSCIKSLACAEIKESFHFTFPTTFCG